MKTVDAGWPAHPSTGLRAGLSSQEIVASLVPLNARRTSQAAAGEVRRLRTDYQAARFEGG